MVKMKEKVTPFIGLATIKDTTVDDVQECMAIWTPNIDTSHHDASGNWKYNSDSNSCVELFAITQDKSPGFGQWADLDCNQRTRAVVCSLLGKYSLKIS